VEATMRLFRGFIARRLLLSFSLLALLAILVTAGALWLTQFLDQTLNGITPRTNLAILSAQIRAENLDLAEQVRSYVVTGRGERPALRARITDRQTSLQNLVQQAKRSVAELNKGDPDSGTSIEESIVVGNLENDTITFNYQAASLLDAVDRLAATSADLTLLQENYQQRLFATIDRFEQIEKQRIQDARARATDAIRVTLVGLAFAAVLVLGGTTFSLWQAATRIIAPLSRLNDGAQQLRLGHLDQRVPVSGNDEIGSLGDSLNTMAAELQQRIATEDRTRESLAQLNQELEERVALRTRDLEASQRELQANSENLSRTNEQLQTIVGQSQRRAALLEASAQVARAAAQVRDPQTLLPQVMQLISEQFGFYHAGVFLVDEAGEYAVLRAANSQGGQAMLARGHRLRVGEQGIVGWVAKTGQPRIALDTGVDAVHFDNPLLPDTRSEMALPLKAGDRILGVLDVQSTQGAAFGDEDVTTLATLADQLAITLESALLFQRTQAALEEAQASYRRYVTQEWASFVESSGLQTQEYATHPDMLVDGASLPELDLALQRGTVLVLDRIPESGNGNSQGASGSGHTLAARSALVAPIKLRDQTIGALDLREVEHERRWTEDEVALVEAVANQVALAVENTRLFEQTQLSLADTRALYEASSAINSATSADEILAALRRHTVLNETDRIVALNVFDRVWEGDQIPDSVEVITRWTVLAADLPARYNLSAFPAIRLLRPNEPVIINDVETDQRLDDNSRQIYQRLFQGRSALLVPLIVAGQSIGFINAVWSQPRQFTDAELRRLTLLAGQAATAIQTRRLFEQTQARVRQLAVLNEISRAASGVLETESLYETLYQQIQQIMDVGAFYVGLYDPNSRILTYPVCYDEGKRYTPPEWVVEPGYRTSQVILSGEPLLVHLTPDEVAREEANPIAAVGNPNRMTPSLAFVPLRLGERVIGLISVQSYQYNAYMQEHINLLAGVANQVAVALENTRLFEDARARALQLATASEAGRAATSILDLDELCATAVDLVRVRFGYYQTSIFLVDESGQSAVLRDTTSETGRQLKLGHYALSVGGESLIGQVSSTGHTQVVRETDTVLAFPADNLWTQSATEAAIALKRGNQIIGVLDVQSKDLHSFASDEMAVLELLCDQLSIAIQNARLYGQTRKQSVVLEKRAADLAVLNDVSRLVTQTLDESEILNTAARVLVRHYGVGHCGVVLLNPARDTLRVAIEYPDQGALGQEIPLTSRALLEAINAKQAFAVEDVMSDARTEGMRPALRRSSIRSVMFLPLLIQNNTVGLIRLDAVGVMRQFSDDELSLGLTLASQVAVAMQNARLFEETRRRAREVQRLYEIGGQLSSSLELQPILQLVADSARELVSAQYATVYIRREGETGYQFSISSEQADDTLRESVAKPRPGGLTDTILRTGRAILIPDTTLDPRSSPAFKALGLRSQVGLPIQLGARTIGVLYANSHRLNGFDAHDQELLSFLCAQAATSIQNALLYEEQKQTAEKLREVDRLKTEFLASMSHELRTPLNSIIGFSRVILKGIDGPLSDLQKQDLEAIHGSGQHLLGLINNILDISKIEAGKMELSFEEVDLTQIIKTVMSTAIGLNKGKPVELKTQIAEGLPTVWADSTRARQVLLNLVSNASKFTEEGSITCFAAYDAKFVTLGVRDSGIGIPQDKLGMIFEEFTQVDSSTTRKYGGTGLGLAISRRFVEMHAGKIWVESELGRGSTFLFTLPRLKPAEEPPEEKSRDGRRVLLAVDDDPGVITLYKRYLEKQGYQVIGVADGRQAVEEAIRLKPDVITVDILMPNKDGWSVIQELRQNDQTRDIPVVVCSIISDQGKGFSLGAADYLVKPITEDDLVSALKRLSEGQEQTNVLIVDDTPDDIRLIRRILESPTEVVNGLPRYSVREACNGAEGIAAVQAAPPDLIILDLMMPQVDGFAVVEALKADPATRTIPIVVVTAKALTEEDHSRLNGHIEALLSKGLFSEQELMDQVALALARAIAHRT
jgi:GAF domain-containing protein/CheY-like chemotaxis protein/HAMP domain-containing protein